MTDVECLRFLGIKAKEDCGVFSIGTFSLLYLLDQCYNYCVALDEIERYPFYRFGVKKASKELRSLMMRKVRTIFFHLGADSEDVALILSNIEDLIKDRLDTLCGLITGSLDNMGITGDLNRIVTNAYMVHFLSYVTGTSIDALHSLVEKLLDNPYRPFNVLRVDQVSTYASNLCLALLGKEKWKRLQDTDEEQSAAIRAFSKAICDLPRLKVIIDDVLDKSKSMKQTSGY